MNNYYGYVSKNFSSKNTLSQINEDPVGLWNSIKTRQKVEKEAFLLQNRVNLLKLEEEKIGKKIVDTKKKMLEYIERKRKDYQEFSQKEKKREKDEQTLIEKRNRNYSSKKNGEVIRKSICAEITKLKRAETVEIKKVRETSLNKIKEYRENMSNKKKEQYLKIKSTEDLIRKNIQQFWDQKKMHFINLHKSTKNENEQISLMKEKEIMDLEKVEENLIKRLEKSQNVDEITIKKLEDVIVTPMEEFIQKYPAENQPKKKKKYKPPNFFQENKSLSKSKSEKEIKSSFSPPRIKVENEESELQKDENNNFNFSMS